MALSVSRVMPRYNPAVIEPKWQDYWERASDVCRAAAAARSRSCTCSTCSPIPAATACTSAIPKATRPPTSSAATERMRGKSVMHPMGWDAFGLPAEQHAIKTGTPPADTTEKNIATFRRQLKMLGFSYDWDRELATTDAGVLPLDAVDLPACCSTPGSTPTQQRGRPIGELPIPADVAAAGRRRPCAAIRTSIAWPISPKRRSTGARRWARCWPTKK